MAERSLRELDFGKLIDGRTFFPSPSHWEDEIIYFLMVDRFSDGKENECLDNNGNLVENGSTPPCLPADHENAVQSAEDAARWRAAGTKFVGGTLAGVHSKLGYLKRLGVTVIWLSPIFKQVKVDQSYHGYGIQDFLEIDANFGTREELKALVAAAHDMGLRVILDIIVNHSGDVFRYVRQDPPWTGEEYPVDGFRDASGEVTLPFGPIDLAAHPEAFPDGAVWPAELQDPASFTRKGRILDFDRDPEFIDGDFFSLKDLHHGEKKVVNGVDRVDEFEVSPALRHLCQIYKFWIAYADIDGYRLDTVKHMDDGAVRYFNSAIHEFAQRTGKDNFYVIGEITGGRQYAYRRMDATGLDAALGISDERVKMIGTVKGEINPGAYFDLFRNSLLERRDWHAWFRSSIVTSLDDHDHVDQGESKQRFCANGWQDMALAVMAMNATTVGIPCIYYGTEQLFDGAGGGPGSDAYIREAMFGGGFGAFRTTGRHFFRESGETVFAELAKVHRLRRELLPLRRGRQYLREISGNGVDFGYPRRYAGDLLRSVVAWSRIFDDQEVLCAINTERHNATTAWVTVDEKLHPEGSRLECLYSTRADQVGERLKVQFASRSKVRLTVPAGGYVIFA